MPVGTVLQDRGHNEILESRLRTPPWDPPGTAPDRPKRPQDPQKRAPSGSKRKPKKKERERERERKKKRKRKRKKERKAQKK